MEAYLEQMLSQARKDPPIEVKQGRPVPHLIHGVAIKDLSTHIDRRGSVFEMFDSRWQDQPDPLVFCYCFTVRPGVVKGWGLHERHEDRYCLIQGEIDLVMFDPRPKSPTFRQICRVQMSEFHRCLVTIPRYVWHADHNLGCKDAVVINFPTQPYDHASPDKYRLPIDTDLIPYHFGDVVGG